MKAQNGFTLVELIIVVTVAGIIMTLATLNFRQLNEKSRVESNVKEIYSTLMRARNDAASTNTTRTVNFSANQVQIGATILNYPRFILTFTASPIIFDRRGLTTNGQTIRITGYSPNTDPALDCIVITDTRINYGKWTGANCVQR
jgi:type IV fimbrial biogenesis protein FimT